MDALQERQFLIRAILLDHGRQVLEKQTDVPEFGIIEGFFVLIDLGRNRSEQLSPRELIRSLLVHRVELLDLYELSHRQNDSLLRFQVSQQDCLSHLHVDFDILLQNSAI